MFGQSKSYCFYIFNIFLLKSSFLLASDFLKVDLKKKFQNIVTEEKKRMQKEVQLTLATVPHYYYAWMMVAGFAVNTGLSDSVKIAMASVFLVGFIKLVIVHTLSEKEQKK